MASDIEATISDQITTLIKIKADIAKAIKYKGGSVNDSDSFASYADKIRDLQKRDLEDREFTSNGTFTCGPSYDGFGTITINVSGGSDSDPSDPSDPSNPSGPGGGSGGGGEDDLPVVKVTWMQDGEVLAESECEYGKVPTYPNTTKPTKEGFHFDGWEPAPEAIDDDKDRTYRAVFTDLSAAISDSWKKIAENGGADYQIGQWKKLSLGKITWQSQNIVFKAYNHYLGNERLLGTYTNSLPPEGQNSAIEFYTWEVKKGAPASAMVSCEMVKVADGEDGSTSTWVARTPLGEAVVPFNNRPENFTTIQGGVDRTDIYGTGEDAVDWEHSYVKEWLNNVVLNAIDEDLSGSIVNMNKDYLSVTSRGSNVKTTSSKLWIPSHSEVWGRNVDYEDVVSSYQMNKRFDEAYKHSDYLLRSNVYDNLYHVHAFGIEPINNHEQVDQDRSYLQEASAHIRLGFCL